jgi:hypothetical protein
MRRGQAEILAAIAMCLLLLFMGLLVFRFASLYYQARRELEEASRWRAEADISSALRGYADVPDGELYLASTIPLSVYRIDIVSSGGEILWYKPFDPPLALSTSLTPICGRDPRCSKTVANISTCSAYVVVYSDRGSGAWCQRYVAGMVVSGGSSGTWYAFHQSQTPFGCNVTVVDADTKKELPTYRWDANPTYILFYVPPGTSKVFIKRAQQCVPILDTDGEKVYVGEVSISSPTPPLFYAPRGFKGAAQYVVEQDSKLYEKRFDLNRDRVYYFFFFDGSRVNSTAVYSVSWPGSVGLSTDWKGVLYTFGNVTKLFWVLEDMKPGTQVAYYPNGSPPKKWAEWWKNVRAGDVYVQGQGDVNGDFCSYCAYWYRCGPNPWDWCCGYWYCYCCNWVYSSGYSELTGTFKDGGCAGFYYRSVEKVEHPSNTSFRIVLSKETYKAYACCDRSGCCDNGCVSCSCYTSNPRNSVSFTLYIYLPEAPIRVMRVWQQDPEGFIESDTVKVKILKELPKDIISQ